MWIVDAPPVGAVLPGLIFNMLNFKNGQGMIRLSVFRQPVIRGAFLLVVLLRNRRMHRRAG